MSIQNIRNFTIISHIDHGKSTLADRFLELTKTVPKEKMQAQYLDKMSLEREHGITIKMHPCRMIWRMPNHSEIPNSKSEILNKSQIQNSKSKTDSLGFSASDLGFTNSEYILNLIDTPGHVDFSYEVSRALAAVEGAVLLIDATKGIQAQTITNLELAQKENLTLLPAINKIDLPQARIEETKEEIEDLLKISGGEINLISAKTGQGIGDLILKIIQRIPPPPGEIENPFKALIFDSKYDQFFGVIVFVRVFEGEIKKGDRMFFIRKNIGVEVREVGYFSPEFLPAEKLLAGEIGYIKTGIKEVSKGWIGDTIIMSNVKCQMSKAKSEKLKVSEVEPFTGYKEPQPKIFASLFPEEPTTFEELKKGLEKLHLTDPAFTFKEERKKVLGVGFQCGLLGLLHFEIILERLKREFSLNTLTSSPNISYRIKTKDGNESLISSVDEWPDPSQIFDIKEEWVNIEIITPPRYFNELYKLFSLFKVNFLSSQNLGKEKLKINAEMPFRKLIENFYDKVKSVSQGFASISFKEGSWKTADLIKLNILILKKEEPSLSKIVSKDEIYKEAEDITKKLKEIFPQQLYAVPIQAAIGGKVIARETVKAKRRDVTAPLYGGDVTRKRKLLEKQKVGKRKLAADAQLRIPKEVILELLKK